MLKRLFFSIQFILFCSLPAAAMAQWSLNNDQSTLSFVTVKADHVAEVHTFDRLSGSVDASGNVAITIELASVNTMIDIRNERMQAMLFETDMFPQAEISARVNVASLRAMASGESRSQNLDLTLEMHGESNDYSTDVIVTRTTDGVVVSSLKPILVTAENHALVSGVEALREVAGLPSISRAVPVSFTVVFD